MKEPINLRAPREYCPYKCSNSGYFVEGDELWACPIHEQNDPVLATAALEESVELSTSTSARRARKPDYQTYLRSPEWQRRRRHMLDRADGRCQGCNKRRFGLQVHHLSYENLGYESTEELAVLCGECHKALHDELKARGEKIR